MHQGVNIFQDNLDINKSVTFVTLTTSLSLTTSLISTGKRRLGNVGSPELVGKSQMTFFFL